LVAIADHPVTHMATQLGPVAQISTDNNKIGGRLLSKYLTIYTKNNNG